MSIRTGRFSRDEEKAAHVGTSKLWTFIVMAIMILAACYFLFPVVWILVASTKDTNSLLETGLFSLPRHIQFFHNLIALSTFQHGQYWLWYLNSMIYAGITGVLTCFVCSLAGFSLAKFHFRGKKAVFGAVMASLMVPGTVIAIPLFILDGLLGIRDSYLGIILPLIVNPFGVYFLRIYVNDVVPDELLAAGKVDGASQWRLYRQIVFPLIRPALATLFLISFIGTWNNFFLPLVVLHSSSLFPVTLGLDTWISSMNTPAALQIAWYPLIITGSLISIIPMVIGFIFLKKYIVVGLARGSIKM